MNEYEISPQRWRRRRVQRRSHDPAGTGRRPEAPRAVAIASANGRRAGPTARTVRTFTVCVCVLLLMAGVLYFGLSRQERAAEGRSPRWAAPLAVAG